MIPNLAPFAAEGIGFAFCAASCILAAWLVPSRFPAVLAAASLLMLASWLTPLAALLLVVFLVPPYLAARWAWGRGATAGSRPLSAVVAWQVLAFAVLKGYPGFAMLQPFSQPVAIIGISFVLFRQIHLVVEAPASGELRLTPLSYVTYLLAFWTLLAGPIQRYGDYCRGIAEIGRPSTDDALAAAHRAVNGLAKAFVLAPIFLPAAALDLLERPGTTWLDAAVVFYAFPLYLFLNFSGYSDLVIAFSRLCGMTTMPENFNAPYGARNIQLFWTRWHISFGGWIRDYVFNPLNLTAYRHCPRHLQGAALALVVTVTFVVVGLWHGTTLNFVVFGLLHGGAVIVVELWGRWLQRRLGKKGKKAFEARAWVHAVAVLLTFHFVAASLTLFTNPVDRVASVLARLLG